MPGTARRGRRSAAAAKKTDTENVLSDSEKKADTENAPSDSEKKADTENAASDSEKKADAENAPPDSESADADDSIVIDATDTTADSEKGKETNKDESKEVEGEEEKGDNGEEGNEDEGEEEAMTVELEIKDEVAPQEHKAKETVEVMIEGVVSTEKSETETEDPEEEVKDIPNSELDSKVNTEDEKKLAVKDDLAAKKEESSDANLEKEALDTADVTAEKEDKEKKMAVETAKDKSAKTDTKEDTELSKENTPESSVETDKATEKQTKETPPVTPTKDKSVTDTKSSPAPSSSPAATKAPDQELAADRPFPASLAKLRNLTVNIGPIRQMDLKSDKLHEILKLSENFEIKFELRDKKDSSGNTVQEKSGFVRLPFEITTPTFLIRVAYRLGNLHIDGRDMSVKFPDAFNKAVAECQDYMEENRKLRAEKFEMRKRQIAVKNVPPNVTEDTIRSLFPEAQKITLNMEDLPDGGKKVGSVLLEFDTEESCIQCLDTNKDVFIEDCQLKIFRLYSERRLRTRSQNFSPRQQGSRGRGVGRGRGMASRGNFQAAKIRNRAVGFGGVQRGRGGIVKRGNLGRNPAGAMQPTPLTSMKSPGAMGPPKTSPRGLVSPAGRGQRNRSFSGPKPGQTACSTDIKQHYSFDYAQQVHYPHYAQQVGPLFFKTPKKCQCFGVCAEGSGSFQSSPSGEGQFKGFIPKRENTRGRQRTRPGRGRGNQNYDQRSQERSPSSYRLDRSPSYRSTGSYRTEQKYSSPSTSREEDPLAMMEYLKTTIARMEQKMTGRDTGDRGYNDRHQEQSRTSQYSPRGRGSPSRGRGRGRGDQTRKRPAETRDYGQEPKRQFMGDQGRRDSRSDYYVSQQNTSTGERRDSVGRVVGEVLSDYRHDRDSGSYGSSHTASYGSSQGGSYGSSQGGNYGSSQGGTYGSSQGGSYGSSYGGSQSGNYGNRSSSYGDSSDRNRRDSYSGRSESYSTGYSGGGGGQFNSRGGSGRGQSRGRGYNKGNRQGQGQLW